MNALVRSRRLTRPCLGLIALGLASCCPAQPPATPKVVKDCTATTAIPQPTVVGTRLIEDFESPQGKSGGFWYEFDKNPLGTVAQPNPFKLSPGGSPKSPGNAAHVWGTLGANRAPWSWVQLQVFLNRPKKSEDLSGYKSIRFYAKGNGGQGAISLVRDAVKDYDHFRYEFVLPKEWTEIRIPLSAFKQQGWGKLVEAAPKDVNYLQFSPVAAEQAFDFWIDDVTLSDEEAVEKPFAYDTRDWFPYTGFNPEQRKGTALDASRFLDAPAGKHGPLSRKGERLVFRDGKEVRFIGVNIVASANFPTHEEADKLAVLLSQLGVNLTRHHHMDAAWSTPNLFGNRPTTLELDPTAMERFDYLISALQKRGIYQFFDMLVHRKLTDGDGVTGASRYAAGLKVEGEFEPKFIELQERFITQFMGHKNAHTGRTYAKDPGVVLLEAINEDSLFWLMPDGEFSVKTPESQRTLNSLFSTWLLKQGIKDRAELEKRWGGSLGSGLKAEEDPKQGTVGAFIATGKMDEKNLSVARAKDTLHFYYDTTLSYYRRIEKHLRSLGYQGLYTGSNHWTDHPLDLRANAELDFVDRHAYWSHPQGGWGYKPEVIWDNLPMVKSPELGIIGSLTRKRVKGLPYTVSEWQNSAPNDYRHEGLLIMGAYAAFQGMHPIQFAVSHDVQKRVDSVSKIDSNFDILEQPTMLGAWPAVSTLFHRGDVRPSELDASLKVEQASFFEPAATVNAPRQLGLFARAGIALDGGTPAIELEKLREKYVHGTRVTSSTGELRHDSALGRFEVDTPRTQGLVTFATEAPITLSSVRIELKSPFGVVLVTSLTNDPIETSPHILVTALGNAVNTGMVLKENRSGFVNVGQAPILVEPLLGQVTLLPSKKPSNKPPQCYPLEVSGTRQAAIPLEVRDGSVVLNLTAAHRTMHYEVLR